MRSNTRKVIISSKWSLIANTNEAESEMVGLVFGEVKSYAKWDWIWTVSCSSVGVFWLIVGEIWIISWPSIGES